MENSLVPIIATILGGIGTIYGPIVGVYLYIYYKTSQSYIFENVRDYVDVYFQPHIGF
jgi:ABC-type branched-subunit amino acid transport system permease subunit